MKRDQLRRMLGEDVSEDVIDSIMAENGRDVNSARERGEQLRAGLREIQKRHAIIGDIRGLGLMTGAEFVHADKSPAAAELDDVLETLKDRGFIIGKNGVARNVMAFQPPLVITAEDIDNVLNALEMVLTEKKL